MISINTYPLACAEGSALAVLFITRPIKNANSLQQFLMVFHHPFTYSAVSENMNM